jgi:exodeoxyribonuclease VIII
MGALRFEDGIHPAVPRDVYERLERTNFSLLKWMAKSPAHFRNAMLGPPEDSDAKKLGRVSHVFAFEPERARALIAVWDGGTRRGKDWDAFCQRNEGRELLTENEYEKCMAIQRAVRADATAMQYLQNGRGEVSMCWKTVAPETGEEIAAKGRIDFDAQTAIVDLKTTKDASPDGFGRQFFALHYDAQAAWYCDGYERATGKRKPYVIVAVENVEPFVVQVYRVPDVAIDLGREKYGRWLDSLAFCTANSVWPGYSAGMELELSIPRWVLPDDEDEITLTSGGEPL